MSDYPQEPFVKVRVPSETAGHYMTFTSGGADALPPAQNPVIEHVAATDPAKAKQLEKLLAFMQSREERFFAWIEESPEHSQLLVNDPAEAVRRALPEIGQDLAAVAGR